MVLMGMADQGRIGFQGGDINRCAVSGEGVADIDQQPGSIRAQFDNGAADFPGSPVDDVVHGDFRFYDKDDLIFLIRHASSSK